MHRMMLVFSLDGRGTIECPLSGAFLLTLWSAGQPVALGKVSVSRPHRLICLDSDFLGIRWPGMCLPGIDASGILSMKGDP